MFANAPILIAEDNPYHALDLSNAIEAMAGRVVGPVSTVSEALFLLDMQHIAGAIVDCDLSDRDAAPLARRLAEIGVPFVIHTATALPQAMSESRPDVPVLMKPLQPNAVLACLLDEMRKLQRVSSGDAQVLAPSEIRVCL